MTSRQTREAHVPGQLGGVVDRALLVGGTVRPQHRSKCFCGHGSGITLHDLKIDIHSTGVMCPLPYTRCNLVFLTEHISSVHDISLKGIADNKNGPDVDT
jgi:hypothetical protein